ncbi:hypothetical protein SDC9_188992 [bioreactor metagenome]|uniref:Uncharacterized protein n=1 Tax=bioreactor metagenome TaxID=1076179 RepID=A0A645HS85_9ZZZZ
MNRAERVRHIKLSHVGELLCKRRVVLFLALFKAQVLKQDYLAGLYGRGLGLRI